ncbi:MAG: SDR family NAD(P)-dependent oxidoreductase, partial [Euryarchaeota archaeon]|nr:SDR family NAD(P)-dependent oxidoreductase [Euryarchaeota archaeon]
MNQMKNKILNEGFPFSEEVLSGKTAVVCGASEGIGRATALLLARSGARVIPIARNQNRLEELITEMHGTGHKALSIDLEKNQAVAKAVAVLKAERASILINNAGGPPGSPLMENTIEDFEAPFKRHLHASHLLVQGLAPIMEQIEFGRIVNVISTSVREPI